MLNSKLSLWGLGFLLTVFVSVGLAQDFQVDGLRGFKNIANDYFSTLDVRVLDDETGTVLPKAKVHIPRLAYQGEQMRGRFRFDRLRKGKDPFEIFVSAPGYETQRPEFISPGENRLITLEIRLKRSFNEKNKQIRPEVEVLRPRPGEVLSGQTAVAVRLLPFESAIGSKVKMGFIDQRGRRVAQGEASRIHGSVWGRQINLSSLPEGAYRFYIDISLSNLRGRVSHLQKSTNLVVLSNAPSKLFTANRPTRLRFVRPKEGKLLEKKVIALVQVEFSDLPIRLVQFSAYRMGSRLQFLGDGKPSKDRRRWGISWNTDGFVPGRYRVVATALGEGSKVLGATKSHLFILK